MVEIERVDNWLKGFTQTLGYAADYVNEYQKLVQPILVVFGSVSAQKITKIRHTCDFAKVVLCHYNLSIKGKTETQIFSIRKYFGLEEKNGKT